MNIKVNASLESSRGVYVQRPIGDYDLETLTNFQEVVRRSLSEVFRSSVFDNRSGNVTLNLEINYAVGGGAKVVLGDDHSKD